MAPIANLQWRALGPLALVLLLIPSSQGATDSRIYIADSIVVNDTDGVVSATSFTYPSAPFSYSVTSRMTSVEWSSATTLNGPSIGAAADVYTLTLTVKQSSTVKITCSMTFSRSDTFSGRTQYTNLVYCDGDPLTEGTTYTYEFGVSMATGGTNRIAQEVYSLRFTQVDSITVPDPATATDVTDARDSVNTNVDAAETSINSNVDAAEAAVLADIAALHTHLHDLATAVGTLLTSAEFEAVMLALQDHFDQAIEDIVMGNVTVYSELDQWIFENVTDHRNHTLELNMNNDFGGMGFDGFVMTLLFLAIMMFSVWRMRHAGPRYLGIFLFATIGFIAMAIADGLAPTFLHATVVTAWLGVGLGVFIVTLMNGFGTEQIQQTGE